jgi:hypothetical protein
MPPTPFFARFLVALNGKIGSPRFGKTVIFNENKNLSSFLLADS